MGLLVGKLAQIWIAGLIPLPVMGESVPDHMCFSKPVLMGLVLPFAATLYPSGERCACLPIDAIKTGHLISKNSGLAPLLDAYSGSWPELYPDARS